MNNNYYEDKLAGIHKDLAHLLRGNSVYGVMLGNIVVYWSPTKKEFVTVNTPRHLKKGADLCLMTMVEDDSGNKLNVTYKPGKPFLGTFDEQIQQLLILKNQKAQKTPLDELKKVLALWDGTHIPFAQIKKQVLKPSREDLGEDDELYKAASSALDAVGNYTDMDKVSELVTALKALEDAGCVFGP